MAEKPRRVAKKEKKEKKKDAEKVATPHARVDKFKGDGLEEALRDIVVKFGKSFVRYDESPNLRDAERDNEKVQNHPQLLESLRKLSSGLLFNKSSFEKALQPIIKTFKKEWNFTKAEAKSWVKVMSARLYNLTQHAGKPLRRKRRWILNLLGSADDATAVAKRPAGSSKNPRAAASSGPPAAGSIAVCAASDIPEAVAAARAAFIEEEEREKEEEDEAPYEYGWMRELHIAFRRKKGKPRELSLPIEIPEHATGSDFIIAHFRDGAEHVIKMTVDAFRASLEGRKKESSPLWSGTHVSTNNQLVLRQRTCRTQLLSLYDQDHQILQVSLWKFGGLPLPQPGVVPDDWPALLAATKFMMPFILKWQKDEVQDKEVLNDLKRNAEKEAGLPTKIPPEYKNEREPAPKAQARAAVGDAAGAAEPASKPKASSGLPKKAAAFATPKGAGKPKLLRPKSAAAPSPPASSSGSRGSNSHVDFRLVPFPELHDEEMAEITQWHVEDPPPSA